MRRRLANRGPEARHQVSRSDVAEGSGRPPLEASDLGAATRIREVSSVESNYLPCAAATNFGRFSIGVARRPWGRYHICVARRDAVLLLDEFVGPKR
jgi:hypothetical protein